MTPFGRAADSRRERKRIGRLIQGADDWSAPRLSAPRGTIVKNYNVSFIVTSPIYSSAMIRDVSVDALTMAMRGHIQDVLGGKPDGESVELVFRVKAWKGERRPTMTTHGAIVRWAIRFRNRVPNLTQRAFAAEQERDEQNMEAALERRLEESDAYV